MIKLTTTTIKNTKMTRLEVTLTEPMDITEQHIQTLLLYEAGKQSLLKVIKQYLENCYMQFHCEEIITGHEYRSITGFTATSDQGLSPQEAINALTFIGAKVTELNKDWKDKIASYNCSHGLDTKINSRE